MTTYAVIRLENVEEEIIIPADSFEVDEETRELTVYREVMKSDGTIIFKPWAQFPSYVGIYLVDDADDEEEDGAYDDDDDVDDDDTLDEEDEEEDEDIQEEDAVLVPVTVVELPEDPSEAAPALNSFSSTGASAA